MIMKTKTLALLLLLGACIGDESGFSKSEVRDMPPSDEDFCALYGWYGDGECDDFCLLPDEDCGEECVVTGCGGELCADGHLDSICIVTPDLFCYRELGTCERQSDGVCGWTETPALAECLAPTEPADCIATGCSGEICASEPMESTCLVEPDRACYREFGTCERQEDGACGWGETADLAACLDRTEPSEPTACVVTGCSSELCASGPMDSACVYRPENECYARLGACGALPSGECGWEPTAELEACLAEHSAS